MKTVVTLVLLIGAALGGAAIYFYAGFFNVAADEPHWPVTHSIMEMIRERSIAVRIRKIEVPALDDPALVSSGARHYDAMCRDCHLVPGKKESEIHDALYPQPPDFTKQIPSNPARTFWTIKHGIKMSGMPAWGKSHDDQAIWGLVAFMRELPTLSPTEYRALTKTDATSRHQHKHE